MDVLLKIENDDGEEYLKLVQWPHFLPIPVIGDFLSVGEVMARVKYRTINYNGGEAWVVISLANLSYVKLIEDGWRKTDGEEREADQEDGSGVDQRVAF